jgi:hypothetical protein
VLGGTVFANAAAPGNELADAFVEVCDTSFACQVTTSDSAGQYSVCGLFPGEYTATAFPPGGMSLLPGTAGPITIVGTETLSNVDLVVAVPMPLPPNTDITNHYVGPGGIPVVYWGEPLTLTTSGCAGGTASYEMTQDGPAIRSGPMTEGPAGTYTATIAPLYPLHGYAHTAITLQCPDSTVLTPEFDLYIDPSGTVRTADGTAVPGATVRLLRADSPSGPFVAVPDGSGMMSVENRRNPDTTDAAGHFGWDVIAGYYKVRVDKSGCVSSNLAQPFVETAVLTIPPPVVDLDVRLACDCISVAKPSVVIRKLDTPTGDDKLTFKGETTLPAPITPPLDPLASGLRLVLSDTAGSLIDLTLPGGAYSKPPGVGWKARIGRNLMTWTYVDKRPNPPSGIYRVIVRDHSPKVPGRVQFVAKGRRAPYSVASADLPLTGLIAFDPPGSQCGVAVFPGPDPAPLCTLRSGALTCK